jgi:hypothetical protein
MDFYLIGIEGLSVASNDPAIGLRKFMMDTQDLN